MSMVTMSTPVTALDHLAANAGPLYSLPTVTVRVLELTRNPQVDAHALKDCIENDPALTVKILRVVNSSLFGLSRTVSDLSQALALLGTKPLKLLVLGFSLPPGLFAGVEGKILGRYWRRTLTKAVAAREICEEVWKVSGDEAFIAGLLQDIGTLVLVREVGDPYVRLLEKAYVAKKDLAAAETIALGFDHTMLSARLLDQWGLPHTLVEVVGWKIPSDVAAEALAGTPAMAQILHLAELVARLLADGRAEVLPELVAAGRGYRNLSRDQLQDLVDHLEEKVRQLADVLSLQLPRGMEYRDVLTDAHAQLAHVADQAAADLLDHATSAIRAARLEEDGLSEEVSGLSQAVAAIRSPRPAADASPAKAAGAAGAPPEDPATTAKRASAAAGPAPAAPQAAAKPLATAGVPPAQPILDPELLSRLGAAVAACRQARCPLSLLLVQLDRLDQLMGWAGKQTAQRLRQSLETVCRQTDQRRAICAAYGDAGFALILPGCERRDALEAANQVIVRVRRLGTESADDQRSASVSAGVATVSLPPKNFPPRDILTAAARCLNGSRLSGGGVAKSIEIY